VLKKFRVKNISVKKCGTDKFAVPKEQPIQLGSSSNVFSVKHFFSLVDFGSVDYIGLPFLHQLLYTIFYTNFFTLFFSQNLQSKNVRVPKMAQKGRIVGEKF